MTVREKELLSIVLEPQARQALMALAAGQKTASEIASGSRLSPFTVRRQLERLVSFGLARKELKSRSFHYGLSATFVL